MKLKVAVICGGYSSEHEISMRSVETVMKHIDRSLYEPQKVIIDRSGWQCEYNGKHVEIDRKDFTYNGGKGRFDFAFIMIHGTPGEDGVLQGYFDTLQIPYSTCNHLMSTITFNKWVCNQLLAQLGFDCAAAVMIRKHDDYDPKVIVNELGLPLFVKPCDGGSSFGVSKVRAAEELDNAVKMAMSEGTDALVESFLQGTEVTCGAYHNGDSIVVLPVTEIVTENDFFDFDAKYKGESDEITPARIDADMTQKVQDLVRQICIKLDLRGLIRIDFIIQDGKPVIIEINTVPGFSSMSIVPKQIEVAGLKISGVLTEVIQAQLAYFA